MKALSSAFFGPVPVTKEVEPYVEALGSKLEDVFERLYTEGAWDIGAIRVTRYPVTDGGKVIGWDTHLVIPFKGETTVKVAEEKLL